MTTLAPRQGASAPAPPQERSGAATVSVVVPTYRRDELLRRCLLRVLEQDFPRELLEIVVVDDARSATTPRLIEEVRREHPDVPIALLPGAGRGPASARNRGWHAAQGDIIAFIDDDAYPADDGWLARGSAAFSDAALDGLGGAVQVPCDQPPTDFQRNVKHLEQGEFLTCNAFYRRSALERVNGFDERFTVPFREDSDLQFRVEQTGGSLRTDPALRVVHPAPPGPFAVSLKLQRYSFFNALMYQKHPERYRGELQARPPFLYYAIVACLLTALGAMLGRKPRPATGASVAWLGLSAWFFVRRARGVTHTPRHLADLGLTSALIPPLSLYWRLRGAIHFRVFFL